MTPILCIVTLLYVFIQEFALFTDIHSNRLVWMMRLSISRDNLQVRRYLSEHVFIISHSPGSDMRTRKGIRSLEMEQSKRDTEVNDKKPFCA